MNARLQKIYSSLFIIVVLLVPSVAKSDIVKDPKRGVFTLAPTLEPILPGVVKVIVRKSVVVSDRRTSGDGLRNQLGPQADMMPPFPGQPQPQPRKKRMIGGSGSGVIIDAKAGLIMTNHHVVRGATQIRVRLFDGREYTAQLVGSDKATDIGLVKIKAENLKEVPIANSEDLQVGDFVVAIGYPLGLDLSVSLGIVSGLGRTGITRALEDFIQTDAAINKGNSGGALLDTRGRLVGINTAIRATKGGGNIGIGFAVPTRIALSVAKQLRAHGEVRRGRLGVEIQNLTPDLAMALGIKRQNGVVVTRVTRNSAAARAGLLAKDIITKVNGELIKTGTDLRNVVGLADQNGKLKISVIRSNREQVVVATLSVPQTKATTARAPIPQTETQTARLFGARFGPLTEKNPVARYVKGVAVVRVDRGSPAAQKGLRKGDVITDINRSPVRNIRELEERLLQLGRVTVLTVVRGNSEFIVVFRQGAG